MSTPANTFEDMMRAAEDMAKAIQKSFEPSCAPQTDLAWPTLPKEWMEMLFGNAINTGGLDAATLSTLQAEAAAASQTAEQERLQAEAEAEVLRGSTGTVAPGVGEYIASALL